MSEIHPLLHGIYPIITSPWPLFNVLPDVAGVVAGVKVTDVVDNSKQHILVVTEQTNVFRAIVNDSLSERTGVYLFIAKNVTRQNLGINRTYILHKPTWVCPGRPSSWMRCSWRGR